MWLKPIKPIHSGSAQRTDLSRFCIVIITAIRIGRSVRPLKPEQFRIYPIILHPSSLKPHFPKNSDHAWFCIIAIQFAYKLRGCRISMFFQPFHHHLIVCPMPTLIPSVSFFCKGSYLQPRIISGNDTSKIRVIIVYSSAYFFEIAWWFCPFRVEQPALCTSTQASET